MSYNPSLVAGVLNGMQFLNGKCQDAVWVRCEELTDI